MPKKFYFLAVTLIIVFTLLFATDLQAGYVCGDADGNSILTISDAVYLINYIFAGGAAPNPLGAGDPDYNDLVTISDAVFLINYIFAGGPEPYCSQYTAPPTTIIVPENDATTIQDFDSTSGTITLDESSTFAQGTDVGDIIIGQDDSAAPNGFLRRVTSKSVQGGSVIVETEPATMMDAFEDMNIFESHPLLPSDVVSYKLFNGSKYFPGRDNKLFSVDLNVILFDQDGDIETTNDQIRLDGNYAFTADLFAEIEMEFFSLKKFEAGIETNESVNLDLTANFQWEFNEAAEFDLAEFHIGAIPLGGVVWLVPTLTVEAHIQGDLTVTFVTGISYTQKLRYGVGYADNSYYVISDGTKNFNYTPPQFTAEFNFEPGASINASCLLYGVAGPYMAGKTGFHFQSLLSANPGDVALTFDLEAILYAVAGVECDVLDLDYNRQWQLYSHQIGEWIYPLGGSVTDIDGNVYQTIKIGDQWWMMENLKVTHYRNGDPIPHVTDQWAWVLLYEPPTGAFCDYDNNPANVATYGRLYNWYAVADSRNIAPAGWHVPTDAEWKQLEMYLGMSQTQAENIGLRGTDEGGKLKEAGTTHWFSPNAGATNESGFTALAGGARYENGLFVHVGNHAFFWQSTAMENPTLGAWHRALHYNESGVNRFYQSKRIGSSVRCVRD